MEEQKDQTEDNATESERLAKQFQSILEVETDAQERFEPNIMNLTSSPEEVMMWWKARDPLGETYAYQLNSKDQSEIPPELERHKDLYARGSLCLFANSIYRDRSDHETSIWNDIVQEYNEMEASGSIDNAFTSLLQQANTKYEQLKETIPGYTKDDLLHLLSSADMAGAGRKNGETDPDKLALEVELYQMRTTALSIVSNYVDFKEPPDSTKEELAEVDEIRMLGLQACMQANSTMENAGYLGTNENFEKAKREWLDQGLAFYIEALISLFATEADTQSNTIWKRLKSPIIKGSLHEALWYLDFTMLKHMQPEKYGNLNLIPAYGSADRPEIGHPEHNRAYDFFAQKKDESNIPFYQRIIQLKSSSQTERKSNSKKKYHPKIDVIQELNFMDINPSRLRAKLNIYKNILEGGFQEADQGRLDKYVLPSVKAYADGLVNVQDFRTIIHDAQKPLR